MINQLNKTGVVSFPLLQEELAAALGPAGDPQRWWLGIGQNVVAVFFIDTISSASVQTVLDAHDPSVTKVQDFNARAAFTAVDRLQFELLFDHENRLRGLQGLPQVTRIQFRDALIARWKVLNP